MTSNRRYPGEYRFPQLSSIAMVEATREIRGEVSTERRYYIASAARFNSIVREHWRIENCLHWVLDVEFKEDQSPLRKGYGARNMAVVRHFAINLVRTATDQRSLKTRRKAASWNTDYLEAILTGPAR